jgi:hypothetical protein
MKNSVWIAIAVTLLSVRIGMAAETPLKDQIVGTWEVVSFINENEKTGKKD